jgi:quinolinate synthase
MKRNTLEKLYLCLKNEMPEIEVPAHIIERAVKPIERMLEISASWGCKNTSLRGTKQSPD